MFITLEKNLKIYKHFINRGINFPVLEPEHQHLFNAQGICRLTVLKIFGSYNLPLSQESKYTLYRTDVHSIW